MLKFQTHFQQLQLLLVKKPNKKLAKFWV